MDQPVQRTLDVIAQQLGSFHGFGVDMNADVERVVVRQERRVECDATEWSDRVVLQDEAAGDVQRHASAAHVRRGEVDGLTLRARNPGENGCGQGGGERCERIETRTLGAFACLSECLMNGRKPFSNWHVAGGNEQFGEGEGIAA